MQSESSGWVDKIWKLFSSMKFGLTLLGIIAFTAGIGTLFPQTGDNPTKAETINQVWQVLGLTHLYSTAWFRFLLGLLFINLVFCSVQRFHGIYIKSFKPQPLESKSFIPGKIRRELSGEPNELRETVESDLRGKRFLIIAKDNEKGWSFIALKRRWGYWGSLITHIAIAVLVVAGLIGLLAGFKGYFMGLVGTTKSVQNVNVIQGKVPGDFDIRVNSFEPRFLPNGDRENWYTDLSILEKGKEVAHQTISTNHPFTYKGISFYQSSWSVGITVGMNGQEFPVTMNEGESTGLFQLPGTDMSMSIDVGQNLRQPTVSYQVSQGFKKVQSGQVLMGQTVDVQGKVKLTVDGWITGLKVKRDPGVPLVWLGFALLVIGLLLSFYWRPLLVYGVLERAENGSGKLTLGVSSARFVSSVPKELDELLDGTTQESEVRSQNDKTVYPE